MARSISRGFGRRGSSSPGRRTGPIDRVSRQPRGTEPVAGGRRESKASRNKRRWADYWLPRNA